MSRLPNFVIIGAQKAGSTALMRHLGDHPEVYLPEPETRYFRYPWFEFQSESDLAAAVAEAPPIVARVGIKSPDILGDEPCAQRVKDVLGDVPLIAILREPVSRALSAYFWYMHWGLVPIEPADIGLTRLLAGAYERSHPRSHEVLTFGLYGRHLSRFAGVFGPESLCVVTDEQLRATPGESLRTVFEHLGVDPDVPLAAEDRSVNTGVYSMARLRFLSLRHRHILREFPGYDGKYLQPATGAWPRIVNRSVSVVDRVVLSRLISNQKPALTPQVARSLADYYREDLVLAAEVSGLDLSAWQSRW